MTDKEYVRSHWEPSDWGSVKLPHSRIHLGTKTPADKWAAAAAFTRERLEQIRQLEIERDWMAGEFAKRECLEHVDCIRRRAIQARILARLESALADMRRGMQ